METAVSRVRQFRKRAEEIRKVAGGISDEECRRSLLILANRYDQLAERVAEISDHSERVKQHIH